MNDLIASNKRRTALLLVGFVALVVVVGISVGSLAGNGTGGLIVAFGMSAVFAFTSYWKSDSIALAVSRAHPADEVTYKRLHNLVEGLCIASGLPKPKVYVIDDPAPNAFATGRGPNHAVVCATQGLLSTMPRNEIEGVMAHELMHVKHRDILIGSVAAAIATAISYIAQMAMFASMFGAGGRDDEDRPNPLAMLLMSLLAPLAASLIQMAVSRSREFEADRSAAELLGSGHSLANALERIEVLAARSPMAVAPAQAQAYIHNPLNELRGGRNAGMARLFSTHPATEERVRRLRAMTPAHA